MVETENKISVLLVEDEHWSLELLKNYIEKREELLLSDIASNGSEALNLMNKKKYDLVFLDINLPGLSGIQILNNLKYLPNTILVTVKKDFALKAFDLGVIDYLLKPISYERFETAVERALQIRKRNIKMEEPEPPKQKKEEKARNISETLIENYELTPQEATICNFLLCGNTREDVIEKLGITKQTMKQHLRVIYSKTIDLDKAAPIKSHGKLHILTNFLHQLAEEE